MADDNNRNTAEEIGDTAKKATATAKDAVEAGKAVAAAATGNAAPAIAYALTHKDQLFKLLCAVIAIVTLCIIGITQTYPTTVFSWANNTTDYSSENEVKQTLSTYNSLKSAAQAALDNAHKALLSKINSNATANGYTKGTPPVQAVTNTYYGITDNYTSVGDDFICLAICAYSVEEGNDNKTSVAGFKEIMDANADKLLSLSQTSSTQNGNKVVTYVITNNTTALKSAFGLTDTQYKEAVTLADNLMTLIEEISGQALEASDLPTGAIDNGSGISNNLLLFLASWESYSATPYRGVDSQNQTIGYGHVITSGETYTFLTKQQALELLKKDLQPCVTSVKKEFTGCSLKQNQIDALVSIAENLGPNTWTNLPTLVSDIKAKSLSSKLKGDFEAEDHCNGKVVSGLLRRRDAEWKMYCWSIYEGVDGSTVISTTGTFLWPIQGMSTYVSSKFGTRTNPVTGKISTHEGIDIAGSNINGHEISAAAAGKISKIVTGDTWYGNYILLDNGNGIKTFYGHMSKFASGIKVGVTVAQGQCIGYVGSTGNSTGPHLHFGVMENNTYVDPSQFSYTGRK